MSHGNQLLRKAGLNLAERGSGKYKGHIKLTKRGNSLLRKHLYFSVIDRTKECEGEIWESESQGPCGERLSVTRCCKQTNTFYSSMPQTEQLSPSHVILETPIDSYI
ncbi:transposase [Paenibacillus silvisoli]|uniref:transposase n=1 Tax=Paenibacillus silvisoli TaxID=3110539 RepID=UPI0028056080|nr:transposase [Paenibacillus silvisoli]